MHRIRNAHQDRLLDSIANPGEEVEIDCHDHLREIGPSLVYEKSGTAREAEVTGSVGLCPEDLPRRKSGEMGERGGRGQNGPCQRRSALPSGVFPLASPFSLLFPPTPLWGLVAEEVSAIVK
jgi:hypothetical protein